MPDRPEKKTTTARKRTRKTVPTSRKRRSAAPRKNAVLTSILNFDRSTKGTHVFTDPKDGAVPTLYVRKDLFPAGPPPTVTLTLYA
jgi:hypothetical protein